MPPRVVGTLFGSFLSPSLLDILVGVSMIAMALWALWSDKVDQDVPALRNSGALSANWRGPGR
jgi:uncharacterized membrane protein YfcA